MIKLGKTLSITLPLILMASPAFSECLSTGIFPAGDFCHDGVVCLFSTIAYEFTNMVDKMLGSLYCDVQNAARTTAVAAIGLFVAIYGFQLTLGIAQLNGKDGAIRLIKLSVVYLVVDSETAWSGGMSILYDFFMSFITESTKWVLSIYGGIPGLKELSISTGGPAGAFELMDKLIVSNFGIGADGKEQESLLTALKRDETAKLFGFFLALMVAVPTVFYLSVYWALSVFMVCMSTMIAFLVATVAIALLLSLAPIFVSFMLFKTTYRFFETWLKFITSFALQVCFSFAVLAMFLYTILLFKPFFVELSGMIFKYEKGTQGAAPLLGNSTTFGVCPMKVTIKDHRPTAKCDPEVPEGATPSLEQIVDPTKIPEKQDFLLYLLYNMVSLVIVSYGFASLQKNLHSIATAIAGPQWAPSITKGGTNVKEAFDAAKGGMSGAGRASSSGGFTSQFNNLISKR